VQSATTIAAASGPFLSLAAVEQRAASRQLLLRLQVKGHLGVKGLRVVVARPRAQQGPLLLGELKAWALPKADGLQLDTMRVDGAHGAGTHGVGTHGVGLLIWAATFAWALETTPCRSARLLAINDDEKQHRRLVRYFQKLGFSPERQLGSGPADLALRLVWGGAGLLMRGECTEGLRRCQRLLTSSSRAASEAELSSR
jgi:hypothetical protein